jgi:PTS system nitrogen regulatory IIA component
VDESVIEGWVRKEGLPHVPERGRLMFDRAQVVAWAVERGLASRVGFLAPQAPSARPGLQLEPLLRAGGIWRDVAADGLIDVLESVLARLPGATPGIRQLLGRRLREPDGVIWAPVGHGLALPHLRAPVALGRESGILALLFLREPLAVGEPAPDGQPVTRLVFFVAPSPRAHLELLAQLSTALTRGTLRQRIADAAPDDEIFADLAADAATRGESGHGAEV